MLDFSCNVAKNRSISSIALGGGDPWPIRLLRMCGKLCVVVWVHVVASIIISSCIMFTSTTLLVTQNSQCSQGTGRLRPTCQKTSHSKLSDFCRLKRPVTCVCRIFPKAKELYSYYRVQSGAPLKIVLLQEKRFVHKMDRLFLFGKEKYYTKQLLSAFI